MKIILESELERYAWETMVLAHRGWWKNHGDTLRDHMEWQFDNVLEADTEKAINTEVERRLKEEFGEGLNITEEEYIAVALSNHEDPDNPGYDLAEVVENPEEERERMRKERQEWEAEYRQEYRDLQAEIAEKREDLIWTVTQELRNTWYKYLLAPEDLTAICDGEVIQGR